MTNTPDKTLVPVEQVDRDAAAAMYRFVQSNTKVPHAAFLIERTVDEILRGRWDKDEGTQAFARHRLASSPTPIPVSGEVERLRDVLYDKRGIAEAFAEHLQPARDLSLNPLCYGDPAWGLAETAIRYFRAALNHTPTSDQGEARASYVLVPREPTEAMLKEARETEFWDSYSYPRAVWSAMLDAGTQPAPPASVEQ